MTTKVKIIIGFIIMIVLLGGMGAFGYIELQQASDGFVEYRRNARVNVAASDLESRLYLSLAQSYDYMISGDDQKMAEATKLTDQFIAIAKEASEETAIPLRKEILSDLQAKAANFKTEQNNVLMNMSTMQKEYKERVTPDAQLLIAKLKELALAADQIENADLLYAISQVWNEFALSLSAMGRFAQSADPEEGRQTAERVASMKAPLERMGRLLQTEGGRATYREIEAAYAGMTKATESMMQAANRTMTSLENMHSIEQAVEKAASALNQDADKGMRDVGTRVLGDNDFGQKLMTYASIGGLLIGALLAAFIIIGIVKVLNELSQFAQAVAGGNFKFQVRSREGGEIGSMVNAMRRIPEVLTFVIDASKQLANDINVGKLRERGDNSNLSGGFAELGNAINGISMAYTDIIDALPMPVVSCGADSRILFVNSAGQRVLGEKALNHSISEALSAASGDPGGDLGRNAMSQNTSVFAEAAITPQGRNMDVGINAFPLTDVNGKMAGYVEIVTDLTEIRGQQRTMMQVAHQASEISSRVAAASEELSAQVEQVSHGAEMQRARIDATASAMTEMNATVLEVARSAGQASEQSDGTRRKAEEGAELVQQVISSINAVNAVGQKLRINMEELGAQAESIGGVMNVISDIADQTNLLALNAAIEAARAGEAGRGFAVVADEVRKLAEKTMAATQEVGSNINAVQNSARVNIEEVGHAVTSVEESTKLANASGAALSEIVELAAATSSVVTSIATAAEEQSATSEEINQSIDEVNRIVAETSDGMVQSAEAVHELSEMAQQLNRVMEALQ